MRHNVWFGCALGLIVFGAIVLVALGNEVIGIALIVGGLVYAGIGVSKR